MVDFTISDPGNTFLSQLKPTAIIINQSTSWITYFTPFVSLICAGVGIWATWTLAEKARSLTSQQRDIARKASVTAQEKLEIDVFDKRYVIYQEYLQTSRKLLIEKFANSADVFSLFVDFNIKTQSSEFLFEHDDNQELRSFYKSLEKLRDLRSDILDISQTTESKKEELENAKKEVYQGMKNKLFKVFSKYAPKSLRRPPSSTDTRSSQVTDLIRPPTGLKAILMRLKRAACEWSRPLQ